MFTCSNHFVTKALLLLKLLSLIYLGMKKGPLLHEGITGKDNNIYI